MKKELIHRRTIELKWFLIYSGPVIAYALLIFFLSSLSSFPETVSFEFNSDKVAHFMEYFIFGCLLYRWFASPERGRKRWHLLLATILIGTGYALSDEWHQSFVPGRDASLWDALFDSLGVGMAAATYPLIRRKILAAKARLTKGGSS
jgi:VanZ family protein